jgi:hypothetical protein
MTTKQRFIYLFILLLVEMWRPNLFLSFTCNVKNLSKEDSQSDAMPQALLILHNLQSLILLSESQIAYIYRDVIMFIR